MDPVGTDLGVLFYVTLKSKDFSRFPERQFLPVSEIVASVGKRTIAQVPVKLLRWYGYADYRFGTTFHSCPAFQFAHYGSAMTPLLEIRMDKHAKNFVVHGCPGGYQTMILLNDQDISGSVTLEDFSLTVELLEEFDRTR